MRRFGQANFEINVTTNVLTFETVFFPNYEDPKDADLNNTYDVQVGIVEARVLSKT